MSFSPFLSGYIIGSKNQSFNSLSPSPPNLWDSYGLIICIVAWGNGSLGQSYDLPSIHQFICFWISVIFLGFPLHHFKSFDNVSCLVWSISTFLLLCGWKLLFHKSFHFFFKCVKLKSSFYFCPSGKQPFLSAISFCNFEF